MNLPTTKSIIENLKGVILIALIAGGFYFLLKDNQRLRNDLSSYKNNTSQLIENQTQKYIELSKKDIDLIPSIKKVLDSLDIRPKEIKQYYTYDYHYHYGDTIIRPIINNINGDRTFDLDTLCLNLSGTVDSTNISFTNIDFKDELNVFLYRQRKHAIDLKLFKIRYGKWQNKVKAVSKCSGDTLPITVYDFE